MPSRETSGRRDFSLRQPESAGYALEVEPQARLGPVAEPDGSQLTRVGVDPGLANPKPPREFRRVDKSNPKTGCEGLLDPIGDELRDAVRDHGELAGAESRL
jgi:hypothetical protein